MSYAVTPLRLDEHRDALARLWAENMSDARIVAVLPERMRWLYEGAPDGPATTLLAVEVESGAIVGCGSFLPRPTWVDGRRVRAGVLCDFAVTRAHRVGGAALAIQRALVDSARAAGLELLYGSPNDRSVAVFKRVGYRVVGEATTWAKPLRSAYKLRDVLRSDWGARAAAVPVDAGLRVLDALRSARARPRPRAELVPRLDGRADALFERARARYGVVGEKSSAYLEWRYRRFPSAEHRIVGLFPPGDERLAGYAVYTLVRGNAWLHDLFADDLDAAAVPLLLAIAEHLRSEGADSVSLGCFGGAAFGERLRSAGFVLRPGKRPLVVFPGGPTGSPPARALDPASWFMLEGELDI